MSVVGAPERIKLTRYEPTEAELQGAIRALLAAHPRVHDHWRVNSGAMKPMGEDGRERFVRFNDRAGHSDLAGVLKDGRALFIETKRASFRRSVASEDLIGDILAEAGPFVVSQGAKVWVVKSKHLLPEKRRLFEQAAFLETQRRAGAVAFFARRVDDVIAHLGVVAA